MPPLPSHQQGKHWEVRGQQDLKMLVIHTAAKRKRAKGAGSHCQLPCMCVRVVKCCQVWVFFCEISFFKLQEFRVDVCANTHIHTEAHLSLCLSEILTTASVPAECGGLVSPPVNNEIKPLHHGEKQNTLGGERQTSVKK